MSLVINEIQVKTTVRYQLTPTMIAIIKKIDNEKYWQRYTYIGTLKDCGGSVKMMLPLWKRVWQIPKKLNIELPYDIASAPKKVGNMLCLVAQLCPDSATPWTAAYQAPQSMGFSRQEYWSGVPLPSPHLLFTSPLFLISYRANYLTN